MTSNPFFLLSLLSSSVLAFFTVAFGVEIVIKIFNLKHFRTRSILRLLPVFSLIVDLLFQQYSIAKWINPFSCASCLQKILLGFFFPQLRDQLTEQQISLVTYLGEAHQHSIFSSIFLIFLGISVMLAFFKIIQIIWSIYTIRTILKSSLPFEKPIQSLLLAKKLQKYKVEIYLSDLIEAPFATYNHLIFIPQKTLEILDQQEIEAVIAHELEHIKHLDPLFRILNHFVATISWWIPIGFWTRRMELDQEMACDENVTRYGLAKDSLASALVKVAAQAKCAPSGCSFVSQHSSIKIRFKNVLELNMPFEDSLFGLNMFGALSGAALLLICMFLL
jgi:Zn-dependent protease with chaperone function